MLYIAAVNSEVALILFGLIIILPHLGMTSAIPCGGVKMKKVTTRGLSSFVTCLSTNCKSSQTILLENPNVLYLHLHLQKQALPLIT